jgi:aconitase A
MIVFYIYFCCYIVIAIITSCTEKQKSKVMTQRAILELASREKTC